MALLPGGVVLLAGSGLLDVVRALETAQRVTRRDGYAPHRRWAALVQTLQAAAAEGARAGAEAVPPPELLPASPEDAVTTREVAAMLGCQPRNVRSLHARGVLTSGRIIARVLVFDRTEVEAERQRRREATEATTHHARAAG